MSWSIQKKGTPTEVFAAVKADPGAQNMPVGMTPLIEGLLAQAGRDVQLATNGHVFEGIGEVHLTIATAAPETVEPETAEALKEEVPA